MASHWAVVVGLNDYTVLPRASLHGAVRDALRMCAWLLDPQGGNVPHHQLLVGLNPVAPLPPLEPSAQALVANLQPIACPNKDAIAGLFHTLVQKSGGEGDRLYVYFAGHGLQFQSGQGFDSAIVAADVDTLYPDRSLSVSSILEYFEATQFLDQFFFFDACRNVPWQGRFRAGQISVSPPCPPPVASPQQFVCLATTEGSLAVESNEGGAFTDALLRGLAGQDDAKTYDPEADRFVVAWNRLFTFVCDEVKKVQRSLPGGGTFVQIPRDEKSKRGALRPADPVLWSTDAGTATFPPVDLSVIVDPKTAAPNCDITVRSFYDLEAPPRVYTAPTSVPRTIQLPPAWYRLYTKAPGFQQRQPRGVAVGLMGAREVPLQLDPVPPAAVSTRGLGPVPPPPPAAAPAPGGASRAMPPPAGRTTNGTLNVDPGDALTEWTLVKPSGETESFTGPQSLTLKPSIYTVRTSTPEGAQADQVVDLAPGETDVAKVLLPPPSPAVQSLGEAAGFQFVNDSTHRVEMSTAFNGAIGNVQLSTVMALAATAQILGPSSSYGDKLRQVNLRLMDRRRLQTGPAVVAVFGSEAQHREFTPAQEVAAVRVAWRNAAHSLPNGTPIELCQSTPAIGQWVGEAAIHQSADQPDQPPRLVPIVPGHGQLIISAPGRAPVAFSLYMPLDRVLLVVIHRLPNLDVGAYVFTVRGDDLPDQALRQVRLLDLTQRYMLRGRFDYPADPSQLVAERPDDPIALLLAAYAWQRRGEHQIADDIAASLERRYPDWSDPLLIRAEAVAHRGQSAHDAYVRVIAAGPPMFAGGLARLWQAVMRLNMEYPGSKRIAQLVRQRVAGVLWTAEELTGPGA